MKCDGSGWLPAVRRGRGGSFWYRAQWYRARFRHDGIRLTYGEAVEACKLMAPSLSRRPPLDGRAFAEWDAAKDKFGRITTRTLRVLAAFEGGEDADWLKDPWERYFALLSLDSLVWNYHQLPASIDVSHLAELVSRAEPILHRERPLRRAPRQQPRHPPPSGRPYPLVLRAARGPAGCRPPAAPAIPCPAQWLRRST